MEHILDWHYCIKTFSSITSMSSITQKENDGSFKDRELANWLLNHNHHWINHYKDPIPGRQKPISGLIS